MARIPGLDVFHAPGASGRPPNIFDSFFPVPANIGNMLHEEDFCLKNHWTLKAPIQFARGFQQTGNSKKEVCLVVHKETQGPDDELRKIVQEMRVMSGLDHTNVLKFYETVSGTNLTDVAFMYEPIGELLSEIIAKDIPQLYEPPVIKNIMRDLFKALSYLHKKSIIHRDIQPENIALSCTGVLKVWNFRNARKFCQKPKKLQVNEFRYQCIELLMESGKYDKSVDIWSANCIFAQLLVRKSIFPEHGREIVIGAIFKLLGFPGTDVWEEFHSFDGADELRDFSKYYKYNMMESYFKTYCDRTISPNAMDLMHRCFRYNPNHRPNADLCLLHPYFSEEPEACPVEDIIAVLDHAAICDQIRKIRSQQSV